MIFHHKKHIQRICCIVMLLLNAGCAQPEDMQKILTGAWLVEDPLLRLCTVYREDGFVETYQLKPASYGDVVGLDSMSTDDALSGEDTRWLMAATGGKWESFRGMRFGSRTTLLVHEGRETQKKERRAFKQWFHVVQISDNQIDVWDYKNQPRKDGKPLKTLKFVRTDNCDKFEQRLGKNLDNLTNPIW